MEVELMVTKRDDDNRQPGEYRAICLEKAGRQSFAILTTQWPPYPSRQGTSFLNSNFPIFQVFVFKHFAGSQYEISFSVMSCTLFSTNLRG